MADIEITRTKTREVIEEPAKVAKPAPLPPPAPPRSSGDDFERNTWIVTLVIGAVTAVAMIANGQPVWPSLGTGLLVAVGLWSLVVIQRDGGRL